MDSWPNFKLFRPKLSQNWTKNGSMGHFCGQKHTKTRPNTSVVLVSIFGNYTGLPKQSDFRSTKPKTKYTGISVFYFRNRRYIFPKMYPSPKLLAKRITLVLTHSANSEKTFPIGFQRQDWSSFIERPTTIQLKTKVHLK